MVHEDHRVVGAGHSHDGDGIGQHLCEHTTSARVLDAYIGDQGIALDSDRVDANRVAAGALSAQGRDKHDIVTEIDRRRRGFALRQLRPDGSPCGRITHDRPQRVGLGAVVAPVETARQEHGLRLRRCRGKLGMRRWTWVTVAGAGQSRGEGEEISATHGG
jgi:hypothetical protein